MRYNESKRALQAPASPMASNRSGTTTARRSDRLHRRPLSDITNATSTSSATAAAAAKPQRRPCPPLPHSGEASVRSNSSVGSSAPAQIRAADAAHSATSGHPKQEAVGLKRNKGRSAAAKGKQEAVRERIARIERTIKETTAQWESMTLDEAREIWSEGLHRRAPSRPVHNITAASKTNEESMNYIRID